MTDSTALLIVDVQYDFLPPDGSLAVTGGSEILSSIKSLLDSSKWDWKSVVASQDYHPPGHISFCTSHKGYEEKPFTKISVKDKQGKSIEQMLWPEHCIQGTKGCDIEQSLMQAIRPWEEQGKYFLVQKGADIDLDAYSAFATPSSPDSSTSQSVSPLTRYLRSNGVRRLVIVGIATDVCVNATAQDALNEGLEVVLVREGMAGVSADDSEGALKKLQERGAKVVAGEKQLRRVLAQ